MTERNRDAPERNASLPRPGPTSDDMNEDFQTVVEQTAAFQRIWLESLSQMTQAFWNVKPDSPPPQAWRQLRGQCFQSLAQSWEDCMRLPWFLESSRQWMEQVIAVRKLSNDLMARVRNELQAPSRDDIDTIMLNVRHMEKRLLDRMEDLASEVSALNASTQGQGGRRRAGAQGKTPPAPPTQA